MDTVKWIPQKYKSVYTSSGTDLKQINLHTFRLIHIVSLKQNRKNKTTTFRKYEKFDYVDHIFPHY